MQPWQERVIEEKAQLDERYAKLQEFIGPAGVGEGPVFKDLHHEEKNRLRRQSRIMKEYQAVLAQRINAFTESA